MNKKDAIAYLRRKNKIAGKITFSKKEGKLIEEVMKCGKIFGDPIAIVQ